MMFFLYLGKTLVVSVVPSIISMFVSNRFFKSDVSTEKRYERVYYPIIQIVLSYCRPLPKKSVRRSTEYMDSVAHKISFIAYSNRMYVGENLMKYLYLYHHLPQKWNKLTALGRICACSIAEYNKLAYALGISRLPLFSLPTFSVSVKKQDIKVFFQRDKWLIAQRIIFALGKFLTYYSVSVVVLSALSIVYLILIL